MSIRVLKESQIRGLVSTDEAREAVRLAFVRLAEGRVEQPDVLALDLREQRGEVHAKGAYIHESPYYAIKVASGFYGNPERGLPVGGGAMWVFDAQTGALRSLLLDNGYLTDLRTGAAGALAAELLAAPRPEVATIVGAGDQARFQLQALLDVRAPRTIRVWARRADAAQRYADEMGSRFEVAIEVHGSLERAVRGADVIVTTTPSREPLIRAEWVAAGAHITAVGSDMPGKVELEPALLARARVVADRLAQCSTQGEIAAAVAAAALSLDDVHAELGDIAAGTRAGRQADDEITVADLTGVGALDAAMAALVTQRAHEQDLGEVLDA
jgi:ornithine cyclodeaminase